MLSPGQTPRRGPQPRNQPCKQQAGVTAGKSKLDLTNTDWIYRVDYDENIAAQMVNFDREQMRRIANKCRELVRRKAAGTTGKAQIINGVFSQLLATFPASG